MVGPFGTKSNTVDTDGRNLHNGVGLVSVLPVFKMKPSLDKLLALEQCYVSSIKFTDENLLRADEKVDELLIFEREITSNNQVARGQTRVSKMFTFLLSTVCLDI